VFIERAQFRSRWSHSGADAYDVVTEFKKDDAWTTAWTVHMRKVQEQKVSAAAGKP